MNKTDLRTFAITGALNETAEGFALSLDAKRGGQPPEPEPPPTDAVVIYPTGGDDRQHLQQAFDVLSAGKTLVLSGMFQVNDTVYLEGEQKTVAGDTAKQSGIRSTNGALMSGPYASMLCARNSTSCRVHDLEFDAAGNRTELVFVTGGDNFWIHDCYLHDIGAPDSGPPFAAIHSEGVMRIAVSSCRVERTGGHLDKDEGVRGIWVKSNECWVDSCHVSDSGHTGVATEGGVITITRCVIERAMTQGTGMKMCQRPYGDVRERPYVHSQLYCALNTVDGTKNGGVMLESCENASALIERNTFKNCGSEGSTFGAVYSPYPVQAIVWRNNKVENCRSFGALRNGRGFSFADTEFSGGDDTLWLEDNDHDIELTRSGRVNVGSNCSDIWVDGQQIA